MRSLAMLVAVVGLALGCVRQSVTQAPVQQTGEDLEVRLYPATAGTELQYFLSEPAFITLFEVVPDGPARLLHPYYREKQTRSVAGLNPLRPRGQVPPLFSSSAPRSYYASAPPSYYYGSGLAYLYLIASRSPLRLDVIEASLRRVPRTFLVGDISESLDRLESLVVAGLSDDEWSSALLPIHPNASVIQSMVPSFPPKSQSRAARRP